MAKVRFGIIGVGNMGFGHLRNFLNNKISDGECVALADLVPEKLERARQYAEETNPGAARKMQYFASGDELIASRCCDAVVIAVPHYFHPDFAIKALQNGMHAMVEKPAGVYTLQVEEMLAEAEKYPELKLGIMFCVRTHPSVIKMRQMIADGVLGRITRLNWIITNWYRTQAYYDNGGWRATWKGEGGGVLYNQAPHNLDLFQWIPNMMPCRVQAHCHFGKWHNIEVEDDVTAYFEYPDGATGVFVTTTADYPGTNRFEITGEYGKLVCEDWKLTFYKSSISSIDYIKAAANAFERPSFEVIPIECEGEYTQHSGILSNFTAAILGKEELYAPASDGLNGVILANAMLYSGWTNAPVDIPFDGKKFYDLLQEHIEASGTQKDENAAGSIADLTDTYAK